MPPSPGSSLAHYKLVEKIGEGGMGVVWKAHDTSLGRDVAIKVLPELFASDPERLARFEREARLLASINHPRIAAVYGFHAEGGVRFLAMELAEGESLAARLARGPLPVADAIAVARQLADALEAAHERGVIHRDLKPGNIMVAPDGGVKVLDFGLAKALEGDRGAGSNPSLSQSPTITQAMTSANVILGTAAYMSPEQARGQAADKRADVWSFGVIVFEMLTGRQLYQGETISDTLAAVLRADTDWALLPRATPARLRRLIERCLTRDARQRLRDVGEARIALDAIAAGPLEEGPAATAPAPRASWRRAAVFAAAGLALGALVAVTFGLLGARPVDAPVRRFVVATRDSAGVIPADAVISPDGRAIAYLIGETLWLRPIDALEPRALVTATAITAPFWSPDSRHVGYLSGTRIMKVPVEGGDPQIVGDARKPFGSGSGAAWRDDDVIVCSRAESDGLMEVRAAGGDPHTILAPDTTAEGDFHEPSVLPGRRGTLYTVHRKNGIDTIELLAGGKRRVLLRIEGQTLGRPVYSPTGHILFRRTPQNPGVWALPFSLAALKVTGEPFLVVPLGSTPSVARDGTLLHGVGAGSRIRQLVWVDRAGQIIAPIGGQEEGLDTYSGPALSPDGTRVAIGQSPDGSESDIWIFDTVRGAKTRLTFEAGFEDDPAWTPDGSRIAYTAGGGGSGPLEWHLRIRPADGTGVSDSIGLGFVPTVAPDGAILHSFIRGQEADLAVTPAGGGPARAVVTDDDIQTSVRVSPRGNLVAYVSFESNRPEVYLRRYPSWSGRWQVSTTGGSGPVWNGAGDRLYYAHDDDVFEVEVGGGDSPALGRPRRLFTLRPALRGFRGMSASFDVTRDGQRFVMVRPADAGTQGGQLVVAQNWIAEFRDRKRK